MTGDTETSTPATQQRHPRKNKVTVEIYKPPAARLQQRNTPPAASAASQPVRASISSNNNNNNNSNQIHNRKHPNPHHNLTAADTNHKPQHTKSPRPNRRKHPQNSRSSFSERCSRSPDAHHASEGSPGAPCKTSSPNPISETASSADITIIKPSVITSLSGAVEGLPVGKGSDASNGHHKPEAQQVSNAAETGDGSPRTCTQAASGDLRHYLNHKKLMQAEEIKALSNAVESASKRHFNKTASPYSKNGIESYNQHKACYDQNYRNNNQNDKDDHHSNINSSSSCVENIPANNTSHDNFSGKTMSDSRRGRPDQMLYIPRGRRQFSVCANDGGRFSNHYNSPLTDYNYRPPSPAFSITSIVSEFSGRQRYDGENFSRPSSRLSIYDNEDERFDGRTPQLDRWYSSSRESTPGPTKPMNNATRFGRMSLKLIERSLNQDSSRPSSRNGDTNEVPASEGYSFEPPDQSNGDLREIKYSPTEQESSICKSPTPNRDSVHSKENVMHPVNISPKKRRSRKNRKRRSQSRDHSYDSMSRERGSLGNISVQSGYSSRGRSNGRGYHRPQDNSYTIYNSHIRFDGPASLATSRVNSRNPSLERNSHEDWRQQKPVTYPNTPVRSQYFPVNSRTPNSSYDIGSLDGPSSPPYPTDNSCRRNSTDKPPSGKSRFQSSDSRRNSFSNKVLDSCSNSARGTPSENLSPTEEKLVAHSIARTETTQENQKNTITSLPACLLQDDGPAHPPSSLDDTSVCSANSRDRDSQHYPEVMHPSKEAETLSLSLNDDVDNEEDEEEPLDWAAEMEREDQERERLREQREREAALEAESQKLQRQSADDQRRRETTSKASNSNVDQRTRRDINAALGREADITQPRQDLSAYETTPTRLLYIPPNERKSPSRNNGHSPPRPRLHKPSSPPGGGEDQSSIDSSVSPSSASTRDEGISLGQSGLAHVLELFDFPASFRTADLVAVYQGYQAAAPVDFKWINDTSALAVFSSVAVAEKALQLQHAQIKSVRLSEASPEAKSKAVTIEDELLPARPRPQTSMMLARRLLSGALGVRVNLSREEREREAKAIRAAKDHKRQVAKQKADVWEGNV